MDQGKRVFERSEFAIDPTFSEHRSVPVAKRRDDEQGRLFFGYFLLAKQKKVTRRRATPGNLRKETAINLGAASARIHWPKALKYP